MQVIKTLQPLPHGGGQPPARGRGHYVSHGRNSLTCCERGSGGWGPPFGGGGPGPLGGQGRSPQGNDTKAKTGGKSGDESSSSAFHLFLSPPALRQSTSGHPSMHKITPPPFCWAKSFPCLRSLLKHFFSSPKLLLKLQ